MRSLLVALLLVGCGGASKPISCERVVGGDFSADQAEYWITGLASGSNADVLPVNEYWAELVRHDDNGLLFPQPETDTPSMFVYGVRSRRPFTVTGGHDYLVSVGLSVRQWTRMVVAIRWLTRDHEWLHTDRYSHKIHPELPVEYPIKIEGTTSAPLRAEIATVSILRHFHPSGPGDGGRGDTHAYSASMYDLTTKGSCR